MRHCEQTESASLPPSEALSGLLVTRVLSLNWGGCVPCCVLYVVTVLLQFVASQKVNNFKAVYGCPSCYKRQQSCLRRKGCAACGLPAPVWMAARSCSSSLDSLPCPAGSPLLRATARWGAGDAGVLGTWVASPGAGRMPGAAAGGAVCPGSARCCAGGAPLGPPTTEEVADPLQSHSWETLLAYLAPRADYEISYLHVFQKALTSFNGFQKHDIRHSFKLHSAQLVSWPFC